MEKNDVTKSEGGFVISDNGYKHIFEAVKLELARQQLDALRRTVSRGIPRVYVDHGHITAKLLLRLEEAPETAPPKPSVPPSLKTVSTAFRKVMVQSVNVNKPEFLSLKADVLSEIEITFKTVVP